MCSFGQSSLSFIKITMRNKNFILFSGKLSVNSENLLSPSNMLEY